MLRRSYQRHTPRGDGVGQRNGNTGKAVVIGNDFRIDVQRFWKIRPDVRAGRFLFSQSRSVLNHSILRADFNRVADCGRRPQRKLMQCFGRRGGTPAQIEFTILKALTSNAGHHAASGKPKFRIECNYIRAGLVRRKTESVALSRGLSVSLLEMVSDFVDTSTT